MGDSRDEIASKFLISTGAVTNIVNEWRNNVSSFVADDLRELSLSLKKAQISPLECGTGLRIGKMMQRFGINEEQFENFMTEIYNKCQILEIAPEQIGKYLAETVNMSEIVFPSQIPNYINTKKREIKELERQIENKHETILELNKEISNLEENQKSLIENNNTSVDVINWHKDIKEELTNMEIPFDDIPLFVDCLRGIRSQEYDVNKIVTKSLELIYFDKFLEDQNEIRDKKIHEIEQLENNKKEIEKQIDFIHLKLSKNQELENIGMGFKELKTIYNTIIEISKANNINPKEVIEKFFIDLNEYDDIVSFRKKAEDLQNEINALTIRRLAIEWRANDSTLLYASTARGTKAPGFNFAIDGTGILGSSTIEQIPFDEENLTAYEIGVKTELFSGTTRLNSAAFYYDYDDFQAFSFEGITNVVSNKQAQISGLEVEITARPIDNLELTLGGAWLDTEVDDIVSSSFFTGETVSRTREMVAAPDYELNGIARYTWPTSLGEISIQGDFSLVGDQFFDIANNPITNEDSYAVYNASLGYTTNDGRYEIVGWVRNLGDEEYRTYAIPVTSLGFTQNMYGKPRWYGVTFSVNWGGK